MFLFYRQKKKISPSIDISSGDGKAYATFFVTVANLVARGGHLILFVSIGNRYGIDVTTDTVFYLYAPLIVIISVGAGVADTIVMPVMHRAFMLESAYKVHRALQRRLVRLVVPVSIVSLFLVWMTDPNASISLIILLLPVPICGSLAAYYSGILNAHGRHVAATLGPLYGCVASIPFVFILPKTAHSLAGLLLMFELAKVVGLAINAHKTGLHVHDHRGPELSDETRKLITWATNNGTWQILGSLLVAMNPLIDILFANSLGPGSVTSVEYAGRLWNLVYVFFTGHLTLLYAAMSKQISRGRIDYRYLHRAAFRVGVTAFVAAFGLILFTEPLIRSMYGMGVMSSANTKNLADLLRYYLLGVAPFIGGLVYVRALSAEGKTKILAKIALISVASNILFNGLLIPLLGLNGIGMATSVVNMLVAAKLFYQYKQ